MSFAKNISEKLAVTKIKISVTIDIYLKLSGNIRNLDC